MRDEFLTQNVVDVTCRHSQIVFGASVVNTDASWRLCFAAEVCPTSSTKANREVRAVDVTSARKQIYEDVFQNHFEGREFTVTKEDCRRVLRVD